MNEHQAELCEEVKPQKVKLACLRVGDGHYALDIMCIREIIRPLPITPVPKAPPFIEGVINLRETVIPIIDLRRRFDLPATETERSQRMIVCAVEGRMVGLVVNEVTEVRTYRREEIQPAPYHLSGDQVRFFPGICRNGEHLFMLLDLKKILASDQRIDGQELKQQVLTAEGGSEIAYDC
mgnify:CR=1 FL=1